MDSNAGVLHSDAGSRPLPTKIMCPGPGMVRAHTRFPMKGAVLRVRDGDDLVRAEDDGGSGLRTPCVILDVLAAETLFVEVDFRGAPDRRVEANVVHVPEDPTVMEYAWNASRELSAIRSSWGHSDSGSVLGQLDKTVSDLLVRFRKQPSRTLARCLIQAGELASELTFLRCELDVWTAILAFEEATLPGDHPLVQAARQDCAAAAVGLGDLRQAVRLLRSVCEAHRRSLTADDPQRLDALHNLAVALAGLGRLSRAQAILEDVVAAATKDSDPSQAAMEGYLSTLEYVRGRHQQRSAQSPRET